MSSLDVLYGQEYFLFNIGLACSMGCSFGENCPAWFSAKESAVVSTIGLPGPVPVTSVFSEALPLTFLPTSSTNTPPTISWNDTFGISYEGSTQIVNKLQNGDEFSVSFGPAYLSIFSLIQLTSDQILTNSTNVIIVAWNNCSDGAGIADNNWTGVGSSCQYGTKNWLASSDDPADQWMFIPVATQNANTISIGDVVSLIPSYQVQNLFNDQTHKVAPLGVMTQNQTGNSLFNSVSDLTNTNRIGMIQMISQNQSLLNQLIWLWNKNHGSESQIDEMGSAWNPIQFCSNMIPPFQSNPFLFVITDSNGQIGTSSPTSQSFYTCPCPLWNCSICNVPGQLAFRDPATGVKCAVKCSQLNSNQPCTFEIDPATCPSCTESSCTPVCGDNQVCERNLSTGMCECVDVPPLKNRLIGLWVLIGVIASLIIGVTIYLFVKQKKDKQAQAQWKQNIIKQISSA